MNEATAVVMDSAVHQGIDVAVAEPVQVNPEDYKDTIQAEKLSYADPNTFETVGSLLEKLKFLKGAVKKNQIVTILEYLSFDGGVMTTSDLQVTLKVTTSIDGRFLVPFDKLFKIISKLKNKSTQVSFAVDHQVFKEEDKCTRHDITVEVLINGEKAFKLEGGNPDDFPKSPSVDHSVGLLSTDDVKTMNDAVKYCSEDPLRPAMTGVYLSRDKIVAADGYTMYYPDLKVKNDQMVAPSGQDASAIIPADVVKLLKGLEPADGMVKMKAAFYSKQFPYLATNMLFYDGDRQIITRTIEERYPDFTKVIPTEDMLGFVMKIDKAHLSEMLDMALIAASHATHAVEFLHTDAGFFMASCDMDYGTSFERPLKCEYEYRKSIRKEMIKNADGTYQRDAEGEYVFKNVEHMLEPFDFAMNGELLKRTLSVINDEKIVIKAMGANKAFVVNDEHLIMPVMFSEHC